MSELTQEPDSIDDPRVIRLIKGAAFGAALTLVLGTIGLVAYFYDLDQISLIIIPPFWIVPIIIAVSILPWAFLGALLGASGVLYKLYRAEEISKRVFYFTSCVFLILGLIILGFLWRSYQDRTAIAERSTGLRESYISGRYENAYNFMSSAYRQTHAIEVFKSEFVCLSEGMYGRGCLGLEPDYSIVFSGNKAYLSPDGPFTGLIGSGYGYDFELEKIDGVWYFTAVRRTRSWK